MRCRPTSIFRRFAWDAICCQLADRFSAWLAFTHVYSTPNAATHPFVQVASTSCERNAHDQPDLDAATGVPTGVQSACRRGHAVGPSEWMRLCFVGSSMMVRIIHFTSSACLPFLCASPSKQPYSVCFAKACGSTHKNERTKTHTELPPTTNAHEARTHARGSHHTLVRERTSRACVSANQIVTWNDFPEGTTVEPAASGSIAANGSSADGGYDDLLVCRAGAFTFKDLDDGGASALEVCALCSVCVWGLSLIHI